MRTSPPRPPKEKRNKDDRMMALSKEERIPDRMMNLSKEERIDDKSTFYVNGEVNRQNLLYWSRGNPHWMDLAKQQDSKKPKHNTILVRTKEQECPLERLSSTGICNRWRHVR
ncbi:Hypothetical predicted protein [Octopus vulgaris]|uniref:Uncharacterized protein n=1 Tax=Octopus vulgaris TaxID=6645 RepID=A0AA36F2X1_OCTVU|nr:Hypothetical predicted protein [Octopus vulgaris]